MNENQTNKLVNKLNKYAKSGFCLTIFTKTMGELTGVFEDIDELFLTLICDSRPEIISTNEIIRFSFKEANNPQQTSTPITQHPNQPEAINTTPQVVEEQPSNILPKETPEDVKPQIEGEKKVKTEQEKNIF